MTAELDVQIGGSRPRLLPPDAPPPAADPELAPGPGPVPGQPGLVVVQAGQYWTPDKAERVAARACYALSKLYGDSMKVDPVELDLVGAPLSAVLNDWIPLPSGQGGDKVANLIGLIAVVGLIVLFRLPDILEAHDLLPRWAAARRGKEGRDRRDEAPRLEPAAGAVAAPDNQLSAPGAPAAPAAGHERFQSGLFGGGRLAGDGAASAGSGSRPAAAGDDLVDRFGPIAFGTGKL